MTVNEHVEGIIDILNSRHHAGRGLELMLSEMLSPLRVEDHCGYFHIYDGSSFIGRVHFDRNANRCIFRVA